MTYNGIQVFFAVSHHRNLIHYPTARADSAVPGKVDRYSSY